MTNGRRDIKVEEFDRIFTKTDVAHRFEVIDDRSTSFRSEHVFKVRAELRSRFFQRHYFWSGGDVSEIPELICEHDMWGHPQHRLHGPIIREAKSRIAIVDLGRTLSIGEEETIHFVHRLRDLTGSFESFLGQRARPGNERISLCVVLPNSLAGDVVFEEKVLDTGDTCRREKLAPVESSGNQATFEVVIEEPAPENRGYRICWSGTRKAGQMMP